MPHDHATQFDLSNTSETCDIVIGLDFGTSCTKVVLQSPFYGDRRAMLVPFLKYCHLSNPYLLPTKMYYNMKGHCSLAATEHSLAVTGLKLKLMNNPDFVEQILEIPITPRFLTIAYIALVLKHTRHWFLSTQRSLYGHFKIRWHVNIGIPSPGYNDKCLIELYKRIVTDAWKLSVEEGSITFKKVAEIAQSPKQKSIDLDIDLNDINVIPEILAEVVGYAKSNLRETGLHVLIDIGASTLDISGFILHDHEGEDRYSFLTSDLDTLGAFFCHQERVKSVKEYLYRWFTHLSTRADLVLPISPTLADYFPKLADFGQEGEKEINEIFYKKCWALINRTLMSLKKHRDPNSERFEHGLPIFVCGGGKNLEIYKHVLDDLNEFWKNSMRTNGFIPRNLPVPENFIADSIDVKEFDRFAVAYGLSFPHYNIGGITPPGEIPDIL